MAKRGRKPKRERKGYFYEEQEQAVIDYINSYAAEEKDRIFNTILSPAFTKMVESIIRRYNLYVPDEEFQETFDDTMSFMLTKLNNFSAEKGTKAYSYCGTICKNYLIFKNTQFLKKQQRDISYEEFVDDMKLEEKYVDDENTFKKAAPTIIEKMISEVNNIIKNDMTLNENERKVGMALSNILENWEDIMVTNGSNKLNKSTFLSFVRETTLLDTKEIRDSMRKYRVLYKVIKQNVLE
jgi:type I site-specific restriction-modification system R (restriction) subunit